jgi:hypothetical protein
MQFAAVAQRHDKFAAIDGDRRLLCRIGRFHGEHDESGKQGEDEITVGRHRLSA